MLSFFEILKEVLKKLNILGQGSFGKGMEIRENIDSQHGVFFVGLETKAA